MMRFKHFIQRHRKKLAVLAFICILYIFCLPSELFTKPTSTVITSSNGRLLGALIAKDGQWRFPQNDSVPEKFKTCVIYFEDEYFRYHPGFNPVSISKALWGNIQASEIKRGGSTITQQVIRLSRNGQPRTYFEKLKELVLATRLELTNSKEKILSLWSSNAPFGGNVVGLDAASWRYFNRQANQLSWAESATLAVLPNSPKLIYPGKNQEKLLQKRNRLLRKLLHKQVIDSITYELALLEELPSKAFRIPQIAPHLLQKINKERQGQYIQTTLDYELQLASNQIVAKAHKSLSQNQIHNMAVLVLDVKSKKVLSYVGNTPTSLEHQKDVDIIDKPRSTGSILKPFLYAAMLDSGELLPEMLVADVPTNYGSYQPENFNKTYAGAISAKSALARSLNVPTVRLLQQFGLEKFHSYLTKMGLKDLKQDPNHYGLTLALGGAESNLWDLCKSYAAMASTVNHYTQNSSKYFKKEFSEPTFYDHSEIDLGEKTFEKQVFDAASIHLTFESMKEVVRPDNQGNWEFFESSKKIAWKTGTSFGFRDAWAIGVNKDYVVGVWVGNADGEGRPGLVGVQAAAPILFDLFDRLPNSEWMETPFDEMVEIELCQKSGFRASVVCPDKKFAYVQKAGLKTPPCPYHKLINVNHSDNYQVNTSCEKLENIKQKPWFVLPPLMEFYYKRQNPFYKSLPKFKSSCQEETFNEMRFIYPTQASTVFLPKDFDGKKNDLVLKIAHSNKEVTLYWYVNQQFKAKTKESHEIALQIKPGKYMITVVDDLGNEIRRKIEVKD